MKNSTRTIAYEGSTLEINLPVAVRGKLSKSGKSQVHSNVNGTKDFPTMMTSVAIDSKYVEGADEGRNYFLVAGVWSVAKKVEETKTKVKKSPKLPDFSTMTLKQIQDWAEKQTK